MTRVLTPLDLRYLGHRRFALLSTFSVDTDIAGRIDVPPFAETDFNSIPRGLWNLLPPTDYGEAGVVHDHLYNTGQIRGEPIARELADRVHRELVVWAKAPAWRVTLYFCGLRLGGGAAWRKHRQQDAASV